MSALRTSFVLSILIGVVACSESRTPEQAYRELHAAIAADDYETVVRLLPERKRTERLADLEARIAEWRKDPDALAEIATANGLTREEVLGQPRLWVLSRFVRAEMLRTQFVRGFQASDIVGVDYQSDDRAEVRVRAGPVTVAHPFVREGGQWCWDWNGPKVVHPPPR